METAMEQRNATATLASYAQDTGDFGPETDVDTPEVQINLTKPKGMFITEVHLMWTDNNTMKTMVYKFINKKK